MEIQISSENGIVPSRDQDCAARLQKLLKAGTMDTIFVLSPGEYFLASAIKLEGLQNVKIIGYGARFISTSPGKNPSAVWIAAMSGLSPTNIFILPTITVIGIF